MKEKEMLKTLMSAGMNVARLNFSHGSREEHLAKINAIKEARDELGLFVAILLDTKGPEIRTGRFCGGRSRAGGRTAVHHQRHRKRRR